MAPASVKKSKKRGCRRCTDLQQKAEVGKRFHFPGEGEFHIKKKKKVNPKLSGLLLSSAVLWSEYQ